MNVSADFARTKVFFIDYRFLESEIVLIIPRGLTVRIAGFHPAGPGSTPGVGKFFLNE